VLPYLILLSFLCSSVRGAGRGWGTRPLGAGHPDGHMGWVIGRDVNGDLGGWGLAGGQGGAGWVASISWFRWRAKEHEQQVCYLLKSCLPA